MAVQQELLRANVDELFLDPLNPRLGRINMRQDAPQEEVLDMMDNWTLDELAISYLESGGFWIQEALLVVIEELNGEECLVVVEGNRRLAALKLLKQAYDGSPKSRKWEEIANSGEPSEVLFEEVPYLLVDNRDDVEAFLGFRHVTGIKEWDPQEKAQYINKLINERGMSYDEVRRKIGSKTPTVRQNYIAYRLLLQIEEWVEEFSSDFVENRFSVMYLSLRTQGVQHYLQINIQATPEEAENPVPRDREEHLERYVKWIFGHGENLPLFSDSRRVDDFGRVLQSEKSIEYLERTAKPNFEVAFGLAGGGERDTKNFLLRAADNIELALSRVHLYRDSKEITSAVERVLKDLIHLSKVFPELFQTLQD